jgi:hypothetical protein
MFSRALRDRLLFGDDVFRHSRRYFWALGALSRINRNIRGIIESYNNTFTKDVWSGEHAYIWPVTKDRSPRHIYWAERMPILEKKFATAINRFEALLASNAELQGVTSTLFSNLHMGATILHSRKSVELSAVTTLQGHNIKLLTLVSILFLPLIFVTSVFGMTNMPSEGSFEPFGITMAAVCVPFFLLIGSLNTSSGFTFWRNKWYSLLDYITESKGKDLRRIERIKLSEPQNPEGTASGSEGRAASEELTDRASVHRKSEYNV